jgi:drug/metabolite transporter (DMT)-like permease
MTKTECRSQNRWLKLGLAVLLLSIVAFWGATFPIVKRATEHFSVMRFLALRFTIAALVMAPFAMRRASWQTMQCGFGIGLVFGAAYVLQTYGLQLTTSSNTGIITGLFIVFVPVSNRLLFGGRTGCWPWLGIGVSLCGLVLLTQAPHLNRSPGDLLALGCAAGFGLHVALLGRFAPQHDALGLSFAQLVTVSLMCWGFWWVEPNVGSGTGLVWAAVFLTAIVCSAAANWVQTLVQQHLDAVTTAAIIMTEPVFAAAFSCWLLGERLAPLQWLGAAMMMAAILLVGLLPLLAVRRVT